MGKIVFLSFGLSRQRKLVQFNLTTLFVSQTGQRQWIVFLIGYMRWITTSLDKN